MSKKKTALVVAFIVAGVAALGLGAAVYAKYISTVTKTGSAQVAKWAFSAHNTSGTITCDPTKTYTSATLFENTIAPGTEGECIIAISNEETEVGIEYSIALPASITGKPTNLKFYSNSEHTSELTSATPLTGTMAPKEASKNVSIYWVWPYEDANDAGYDTADTTDGANAASMSVEFTVTGKQLQPVVQQ